MLPIDKNQGHLSPQRTADTHTFWKLPAKSGGAAFGGVGGILLLAAQLGDSGECGAVPVVPDIQSHLQSHKRAHHSGIFPTLITIMNTASGILTSLLCCYGHDRTAGQTGSKATHVRASSLLHTTDLGESLRRTSCFRSMVKSDLSGSSLTLLARLKEK